MLIRHIKMNTYKSILFWEISFHVLTVISGCERSLEVRGVEDICWTKNVEVVERIHYTGKSVLNFAKKKLGMDVEAENGPQKCDYYMCIFQELKMLNGNEYPCYDRMTMWIKNNVIYHHAIELLSQAEKCTAALSNSTISGTHFFGDLSGDISREERDENASDSQSKCDIAAEYMKCMSLVEKDQKCPVFQYP